MNLINGCTRGCGRFFYQNVLWQAGCTGYFRSMDNTDFTQEEVSQIREILQEHGNDLKQRLKSRLNELNLRKTGKLHDSVDFSIEGDEKSQQIQMSFSDYGRYMEIRFYQMSRNRKILSLAGKRKETKEPKKADWYSPVVYGMQKNLRAKFMERLPETLLRKMTKSFSVKEKLLV